MRSLKSYGERYNYTKVKFRFNKAKVLKLLFLTLFICEIILGVLWALGF